MWAHEDCAFKVLEWWSEPSQVFLGWLHATAAATTTVSATGVLDLVLGGAGEQFIGCHGDEDHAFLYSGLISHN
jgi:hypothetical protein